MCLFVYPYMCIFEHSDCRIYTYTKIRLCANPKERLRVFDTIHPHERAEGYLFAALGGAVFVPVLAYSLAEFLLLAGDVLTGKARGAWHSCGGSQS